MVSNPAGIDTDVPTTSGTFGRGSTVQLTATADTHSTFDGWTGDVTSTDATISVTMSANRSVTATFTAVNYTLTVNEAGSGGGGVTSDVGGIDTSGLTTTDNASLAGGSAVQLTAAPDADSTFSGWSGDIASTDEVVTVTMDAAKTVTATFLAVSLNTAAAGNGQVTVEWDET